MASAADLRVIVQEVLAEVLPDGLPEGWPAERPLVEAGLDSVGVLQLVAALEGRTGAALPDEDLSAENFATVGNLVRLLKRRANGAAGAGGFL